MIDFENFVPVIWNFWPFLREKLYRTVIIIISLFHFFSKFRYSIVYECLEDCWQRLISDGNFEGNPVGKLDGCIDSVGSLDGMLLGAIDLDGFLEGELEGLVEGWYDGDVEF